MLSITAFILIPVVVGGGLLWRDPRCRRVRIRTLAIYVLIVGALIGGALMFVAYSASARVPVTEFFLVLWFTFTLRLLWELWSRSVGRLGQRWVRWGRRRARRAPTAATRLAALVPFGRAALTGVVFIPLVLSFIATHRFKLADGQDPLHTLNTPFESVRIPTGDGLMLDAWFVPGGVAGRTTDRTIVICHGAGANKGNFVWFLVPLMHRGYNLVMFDFRAHGRSTGRICTYGLHERRDVMAVVDWLRRERPAQSRRIVGLGSSLGATALVLAAAEDERLAALVIDSPFVSPRELAEHHTARVPLLGPAFIRFVLWEMSGWTGADFLTESAEAAVARLGARPVLVVHGDEDVLMPASHAQRLYDAARGPRELWFGPGPHSNILTTAPDEYGERVFAFLARVLSDPE